MFDKDRDLEAPWIGKPKDYWDDEYEDYEEYEQDEEDNEGYNECALHRLSK